MAGLKMESRPTSRVRPLAALGAHERSRARGHLRAAVIPWRTRASKFGRLRPPRASHSASAVFPLPHSFAIMFMFLPYGTRSLVASPFM